jgi:salicylate hydroxylase
MDRDPVLVAGAGIGGLATALTLSRAGYRVVVLERAPVLEEVGAGIQITPNASRVLVDLGLGPALARLGVVPEGMDVRSGRDGRLLTSTALGPAMADRYGAPWWVIHRADLQAILVEAATADPNVTLRLGATAAGLRTEAARVDVELDGPEGRASLRGLGLVGADGLWSTTRRLLGDVSPPTFRGRTAWRATLPIEAVPAGVPTRRLGLWLGPGAHLVHYPVRSGAALNLVAVVSDRAPREGWSGPGEGSALIARFAGWTALARSLVAAPAEWKTWSLADRDAWFGPGRGPVTLLGDAAHPMLPFLAQGGAMAIEDASGLAQACAAHAGDVAAGFRAYEQARARRVGAVQRGARANGRIYHLEGPAAWARDKAMGLIGGAQLVARYDWIYRHGA